MKVTGCWTTKRGALEAPREIIWGMRPPRKDSRKMGPVPVMEAGFPHKDTPCAALPQRAHCQERAMGKILAVAGTGQEKQGLSLPTAPPAEARGRNGPRPPGGTSSQQD